MTWLSNVLIEVLIEVLATIIYMFVLFPCWIVLHLCFMVLVVISTASVIVTHVDI